MGERSIDIQVLGQLRVEVDGVVLPTVPPKERALLELLALTPGRPVPVTTLLAGLWGDDPPPSAVKNVRVLVYRLRRRIDDALAEAGRAPLGERLLGTEPDAYVLIAPNDAVDVARFEHDLDDGREALAAGRWAAALTCFDRALGAWRGLPLYDLGDREVAATARTRLDELRRAAEDDRSEARLALGQHAELVGDLEAALRADPLRERRWGQLMVALYRSGRQADALRAYQRVRTLLGEELGIEPGTELRRLEAAVIAHDPSLDLQLDPPAGQPTAPSGGPAAPTVDGAGEAAGKAAGKAADEAADGRAETAPERSSATAAAWIDGARDLPLVGRDRELRRLEQAWASARDQRRRRIVTVAGPTGAGKTRLIAELAHRAQVDGFVVAGAATTVKELSSAWLALEEWALSRAAELPGSDAMRRLVDSTPDELQLRAGERARVLGELLINEVQRHPVALVVDDIEMFAPVTFDAVGSASELAAHLPVLLVGSYATGADAERPELAELRRTVVDDEIVLEPLAPDDAARVLADALGPAASASDPAVLGLAGDVGGSPGYLTRLAQQLAAEGAVDEDGRWVGSAPQRLDDLELSGPLRVTVQRSLERLADPVRSLLAAVGVAGPCFDRQLAVAATGAGEAEVAECLEQAAEGHAVITRSGTPVTWRFTSEVERRVLVGGLPPARRRAMEARVAGADPAEG